MTTIHFHISVRGMLGWDRRQAKRALRWVTRDDGTRYATVEQLRDAMMDELAKGHEVLPVGRPCEGFDYKTGCPGHPSAEYVMHPAAEPRLSSPPAPFVDGLEPAMARARLACEVCHGQDKDCFAGRVAECCGVVMTHDGLCKCEVADDG